MWRFEVVGIWACRSVSESRTDAHAHAPIPAGSKRHIALPTLSKAFGIHARRVPARIGKAPPRAYATSGDVPAGTDDGAEMSSSREAYYSSFWHTYGIIQLWTLPTLVVIAVTLQGWRINPVGLLISMLSAAALGLVLVLIAVPCFPVYVEPDGIRSYDFWGMYHTVAWPELVSIRTINLGGLRYLLIRRVGGPLIFVSLFLSRMGDFRDSVQRHASDENPLARELAMRL